MYMQTYHEVFEFFVLHCIACFSLINTVPLASKFCFLAFRIPHPRRQSLKSCLAKSRAAL